MQSKTIILKVLAIALIISLTAANILVVGLNVVSYAASAVAGQTKTNSNNVTFDVYFKGSNGEILTSKDECINSSEIKLYVQIAVNNEGYFNGTITLGNSNFNLKEDSSDEKIKSISGNTVTLNQINAGEIIELELGIEAKSGIRVASDFLNRTSEVNLNGVYKDSTEKDVTIDAQREVVLNLTSPYDEGDGLELTSEIITNKVYEINGENKRIVQVLIESGLRDNGYPIKTTNIEVTGLEGAEEVEVISRGTEATNGKDETAFDEANWEYVQDENKVTIEVENQEENGTISWSKGDKDSYIVTYILEENAEVTGQTLSVKAEVTLYDTQSTIKGVETEVIITEEVDGIVETKVETEESSIYKGKIYSGEDREYTVTTDIYASSSKTGEEIEIELSEATYEAGEMSLEANSQYKTTVIEKAQVTRVLGENGFLNILDSTGNILANITQSTTADENGNITITYPEGIKSIRIETSEIVETGTITINSTKVIKSESYSREIIGSMQAIKETATGAEARIELQETTSEATIEVSQTSLSTITENSNVEIRAVLKTSSEAYDLYKNPTVKVILPSQVETLTINSINLLYESEMVVTSGNIYEENGQKVIEIQFSGEQTTHRDISLGETTIIINANMILNKKASNSSEAISLVYTNENGAFQGEVQTAIEVVSPMGIVAVNNIDEYGLSSVGEEETMTAELALASSETQSQVDIEIINNNDNAIRNVTILGTFPTKQEENTIDAQVSAIEAQGVSATVYYTENEDATNDLIDNTNGWTTTFTDSSEVKKYLIVIDQMEVAQSLTASYSLTVPSDLGYNETTTETYEVTYTDAVTGAQSSVSATTLELTTGKGAELTAVLTATVGQEELTAGSEVLSGEVIKYSLAITNSGTEEATNVQVTGSIPEGTDYVERTNTRGYEVVELDEYTTTIDTIPVGETVTVEYEVQVSADTETGTAITNQMNVSYSELSTSSEEITVTARRTSVTVMLETKASSGESSYQPGASIEYFATITNSSDSAISNVEFTWELPEEVYIIYQKLTYNDGETEEIDTIESFTISEIEANSSVKVSVIVKVDNTLTGEKTLTTVAKVVANGEEVTSNSIEEKGYGVNNIDFQITSDKENEYLSSGDEITYTITIQNNNATNIYGTITDTIPSELTILSITVNDEEYSLDGIINNKISIVQILSVGESAEIVITAVVNYDETREEAIVITNQAEIDVMSIYSTSTQEISNIILGIYDTVDSDTENPDGDGSDGDGSGGDSSDGDSSDGDGSDGDGSDGDGSDGDGSDGDDQEEVYYMISGVVWLDENEDGQRDSGETMLEGVNVMLLDMTTGNIATNSNGEEITATTSSSGLYLFSQVPQGNYIVVFEYDTSRYIVTSYQKSGVEAAYNSDAITQSLTINGVTQNYAVTDNIEIADSNISNIDLGLVNATTFDMQLEKYVSRIIVQNSAGTETYEFTDSTLAKVEIAAKQLQNSTVIIEYQIKVTNVGEAAGYVRSVVDYIPTELDFSSEMNTDWYQSGNYLYNTSLTNTKIEAGETKVLTLTLTKTMTEENTGRFNNSAEIADAYNELGLQDINSTPANQEQNENDYGSADVIISVKTGAMVAYVGIIIFIIAALAVVGFFIGKRLEKQSDKETDIDL